MPKAVQETVAFIEGFAYFSASNSKYLNAMYELAITICSDCQKECEKQVGYAPGPGPVLFYVLRQFAIFTCWLCTITFHPDRVRVGTVRLKLHRLRLHNLRDVMVASHPPSQSCCDDTSHRIRPGLRTQAGLFLAQIIFTCILCELIRDFASSVFDSLPVRSPWP